MAAAAGGLVFVVAVVAFLHCLAPFGVLFGFALSLTDYDPLNPPEWVALEDFRNLLDDQQFLTAADWFAGSLIRLNRSDRIESVLMPIAIATVFLWIGA